MTPRARGWLRLGTLLLVVSAVLLAWGGFRYHRAQSDFRQLPAGQPAQYSDSAVILISLTAAETVDLEPSFLKPLQAGAGEALVVAILEMVTPAGGTKGCALVLVGRGGDTWSPEPVGHLSGTTECYDAPPGSPTRTSLIFRVPAQAVASLTGIGSLGAGLGVTRWVVTPREG